MQHSVLTQSSGHTVQPRQVCLTVSCVYTHPVQGLASLRTLDYNKNIVHDVEVVGLCITLQSRALIAVD